MALQFHGLKITEVTQETPDAVSIALEVPPSLKEEFAYKPGQYLTVRVMVDGNEFRRAYSLSSSPHVDDTLKVTTKRVEKGVVSNWLNDKAKPGDILEVMPPLGNFTPAIDEGNQKAYIFFSGGSGITPVISILKSVLEKEPGSHCTLFYGNRNAASIIFHRELMQLKQQYAERFTQIHIVDHYEDDWKGYSGIMDAQRVGYFLDTYCRQTFGKAEYFICGPGAMMDEVQSALQSRFIPKENVHIERFSSAVPEGEKKEAAPAAATSSGEGRVKIILDGTETEIEVPSGETILEAAVDAGLDPPYACQIAACATCRAKVTEGKVEMDEREALTDGEMKEGYVLTCQARPVTPYVVVNYDA